MHVTMNAALMVSTPQMHAHSVHCSKFFQTMSFQTKLFQSNIVPQEIPKPVPRIAVHVTKEDVSIGQGC